MNHLGICQSCGARLLWVRSATDGELQALDRKPVADGDVRLHRDGIANLSSERYRLHLCPEAAKHRWWEEAA